jgi:pyruvate formate lyase activating enzyme
MTSQDATALPPIAGYHPTTLIDWPGRLAAIVFLPLCNLRCRFCHAGPLLGPPAETIPLESVLEHIASRDGWLDGVVICGGEPTLWPTLPRLCQVFREAGLKVKLDTNGTNPTVVAHLIDAGLVDAVAMDLKAPLDERYRTTCGAPDLDLAPLGRTIDLLRAGRVEYEFRTTVCPPLLGGPEIAAMGAQIAGAARWVLQRFEQADALDADLRDVSPYNPAEMEALAEIGRAYVHRCVIRGQPERSEASAVR